MSGKLISCAGEEFDPAQAEVFCKWDGKPLYFQVILLYVFANGICVLLFQSFLHALPAAFILLIAILNIYMHLRLKGDMAKGFYFAGFDQKIYVRSGYGEYALAGAEIKHVSSDSASPRCYILVREGLRDVHLPGFGKEDQHVHDWLAKKFKTLF